MLRVYEYINILCVTILVVPGNYMQNPHESHLFDRNTF